MANWIHPIHPSMKYTCYISENQTTLFHSVQSKPSTKEPERAAATGLSAETAKVPREGSVCQLKQGLFSSLWAASRPCGPVLGFLRARCSWSTLNKANSGKCFITVGLKMDGLSVPSPVQDPAPGLRTGYKRPGLCFASLRLLLGVILRCQVAANVLAANGREATPRIILREFQHGLVYPREQLALKRDLLLGESSGTSHGICLLLHHLSLKEKNLSVKHPGGTAATGSMAGKQPDYSAESVQPIRAPRADRGEQRNRKTTVRQRYLKTKESHKHKAADGAAFRRADKVRGSTQTLTGASFIYFSALENQFHIVPQSAAVAGAAAVGCLGLDMTQFTISPGDSQLRDNTATEQEAEIKEESEKEESAFYLKKRVKKLDQTNNTPELLLIPCILLSLPRIPEFAEKTN
ncbi:hypothetical protein PAMP_017825 [Pampus punctatissimus]